MKLFESKFFPRSKSPSISRQLMFIVFSLYCMVAVTVTIIHMVKEYYHTQTTIKNELQSYEKIFGPILSKALWDLDRDRINEVVMGMSQVPIIVGIKVERIQGDSLITIEKTGLFEGKSANTKNGASNKTHNLDNSFDDLFSYRFPVSFEFLNNKKKLGYVTLYSNSTVILNRVQLGFFFLIINAIIKGVALWLIFLWVSKYILLKPLRRLTYTISDLNFDNLSNFKINLKTPQDNELTVIENAVTTMVRELDSAKHEVLEFNKRLEDEVNLRTRELVKAKIFAEKSANAKSEFLAKMSHEIRTPMNGVLGMLHLILKDNLSNSQKEKTLVAQSSAQSLLNLINDILDFSKIDANKLELEIIDFDLHQLISNVTESFAHQAEEKELEIHLELAGVKQHWVKGDPSRIRQILSNLISNAIKFTPQGFILIKAKLTQDKAGHHIFTCMVQDSGIGIPEDKVDSLFNSFTQGDASTTRQYGGTGLGLTIVKKLCELMHGNISIESKEGSGSQFECTLSLGRSNVIPPVITIKEDVSSTEEAIEWPPNSRILMVEDNHINQLVAQNLLEVMGLDYAIANDGLEALEVLNQASELPPFSLILMDCQMPKMDGYQATKEIREGHAGDYYKNTTIIALTANAMKGDREKCLKQGMNDYLAKPIDPDSFQKILKKWLISQ